MTLRATPTCKDESAEVAGPQRLGKRAGNGWQAKVTTELGRDTAPVEKCLDVILRAVKRSPRRQPDRAPRRRASYWHVWRFSETLIGWTTIDNNSLHLIFSFYEEHSDVLKWRLRTINNVQRTQFCDESFVAFTATGQFRIDVWFDTTFSCY